MPKYFEYNDPEMAAHVGKMVESAKDAEKKETVVRDCQERPKEYAINNKDQPFAAISNNDVEHRHGLASGGGKDRFVVAKHREDQQKFVEKYDRLASDRDEAGNFHISVAQAAKVAKVVQETDKNVQKSKGYLTRIKEAISLSKEAREARAEAKATKKAVQKMIKAGDKLTESD